MTYLRALVDRLSEGILWLCNTQSFPKPEGFISWGEGNSFQEDCIVSLSCHLVIIAQIVQWFFLKLASVLWAVTMYLLVCSNSRVVDIWCVILGLSSLSVSSRGIWELQQQDGILMILTVILRLFIPICLFVTYSWFWICWVFLI